MIRRRRRCGVDKEGRGRGGEGRRGALLDHHPDRKRSIDLFLKEIVEIKGAAFQEVTASRATASKRLAWVF